MKTSQTVSIRRVWSLLTLSLTASLILLIMPVVAFAQDTDVLVMDRMVIEETADECGDDDFRVMGYIVYITKSGSMYHSDGCRYLSKSKIPIDIDDARARGYAPCSVCRPDDYYTPDPEPEPDPEPDPEPEPEPPYGRFPDVGVSHWAGAVIERAADLGLVNGYDNGNFGPEDNVTRGQAVVILWNMAGRPRGYDGIGFADVDPDAYYAPAISWASAIGVVSGYRGTDNFGPNDKVTREQLAVMITNYARKYRGFDTDSDPWAYRSMHDADEVSEYAKDAMCWCFERGILSGSNGYIMPKNTATRAQAAKMMVFLHDLQW